MEGIKKYLKLKNKREKSIHTSRHALAKELSEYFHEEEEYKKYLGVCYLYPEEKVRQLFAEIKEETKRNFKFSPVKKFFWGLKEIPKINPAVRGKKKKTKKKKKQKRG